MEIWILLAAAGSGYFAHCWQNLHKSKEASSDASDDDDDHSGSSCGTLSSTRRYSQLPSSNRRFKASSYQSQHVSKLSDSVGKMTVGCATYLYDPVSDVKEMDEAQALQNGVTLDACGCSKISTHSQKELYAAGSGPTNTKNSSVSPPTCPALHTFNAFCALNCCSVDFPHQSCKGRGLMSAEAIPGNWHSAYCIGDSATGGNGSMLRDEFPLKLIYDAQDNDMASEEEAFLYDKTLMLGFLNASEGTSVLETSTSFMMQDHEGRSNISTSKVKSHQRNGRSRRNRNLESRFPSTFSEICSSVQLDNVCSQEEGESNIHSSSACELPYNGLRHSGNESAEVIVSDSLLTEEKRGLLPASRNEIIKVLNKIKKSKSLVGEEAADSSHMPCLPLPSSRRGKVNAPTESSPLPGGDSFISQGTDNLMKTVLFNFGVGVGVMFTFLSNKHGTMQSIGPLEETLCLLKELEEEFHGRTKLMFECYQTKEAREDALAEQINELFEVVMRIFDAVERVRNSLPQDLACISAMDFKHSKERAKLEAELEAELEKMEMDLSSGEVDLGQRFSNGNEDDLKVGNLIQGELSSRGLPCDAESSTEIDVGADSCYEIIQDGNFAVSAVELSKRLREVLEARQEREILELEAEVKHLDGRLQAKQEELQVWKQRALHLLQGGICESCSSLREKDACVEAVEVTEKVRRTGEPCGYNVGKNHSIFDSSLSSGCNKHISKNCSKEARSLHLRVPQPVLIHEADDQISDHFLTNTVDGSPSTSPNGLFTGVHAKANGNRGMSMSHLELELMGFLNDATDDTPDNSPCSVKLVDKHTIHHHHLKDKLEHKVGMEAIIGKSLSNSDWNEEVVPASKATSCFHDNPAVCTHDVIEISENYAQFRHALDWSTSEDGSYSSDLDEKLGQLLIKRIVEKRKRGSLIVEVAQSAMASFDND